MNLTIGEKTFNHKDQEEKRKDTKENKLTTMGTGNTEKENEENKNFTAKQRREEKYGEGKKE